VEENEALAQELPQIAVIKVLSSFTETSRFPKQHWLPTGLSEGVSYWDSRMYGS